MRSVHKQQILFLSLLFQFQENLMLSQLRWSRTKAEYAICDTFSLARTLRRSVSVEINFHIVTGQAF